MESEISRVRSSSLIAGSGVARFSSRAAGALQRLAGGAALSAERYSAAALESAGLNTFIERLPLVNVLPGGDVRDALDETLEPQRHDRYAPLVLLHCAGRPDQRLDGAPHDRFGFRARSLNLPGRQLDGPVVGVLAFVNGDIVHPHRVPSSASVTCPEGPSDSDSI